MKTPLHVEERVAVFERVLATPFELDAKRKNVLRCEGRADRTETVLKQLLVRWAQWRMVETGTACGVGAVRVVPMRVVRRRVAR